MKREKYYSTLKVQQEMLKDTYNGKRGTNYAYYESRWFYDGKFEDDVWFMYKGVALYRSDNTLINILKYKKMNLEQIIHDLSDNFVKVKVDNIISVDNKKELIILLDDENMQHKIDKKFLDVVNLDPNKCKFYIKENSKHGIVSVRDEEKTLLAGIMEVIW